jgi:hypothetical protein
LRSLDLIPTNHELSQYRQPEIQNVEIAKEQHPRIAVSKSLYGLDFRDHNGPIFENIKMWVAMNCANMILIDLLYTFVGFWSWSTPK